MLSPMQRAMIDAMRHGPVPGHALIDRLYGDCADGGPDNAYGVVRVQVHNIRAKLSSYGIEIELVGEGRSAAGYRVRPEHRDALDRLLGYSPLTDTGAAAA